MEHLQGWRFIPFLDPLKFELSTFNGNIGTWDVTSVTSGSKMFAENGRFNSDISNWQVGNMLDMSNIFSGATSFNQDLSKWDGKQYICGAQN